MQKIFNEKSLPEKLIDIASLPIPDNSFLSQASEKVLVKTADHFFNLWKSMVFNFHPDPELKKIEIECTDCGSKHIYEFDELWNRCLLIVGLYYDYCAKRLIKQNYLNDNEMLPGINLDNLNDEFALRKEKKKSGNVKEYVYNGMEIFFDYNYCIYVIGLYKTFGNRSNEHIYSVDYISHLILTYLHSHLFKDLYPHQNNLVLMLSKSLLTLLVDIYKEKSDLEDLTYESGIFSELKLSELKMLASRSKAVIAKYGDKQIENIFEQQLALILLSFGFYVVKSRKGERTIDLVCISKDGDSTIIVEAKTSSRPYSLPTKDERALIEYSQSIKEYLKTFPPLRLILIVSNKPAKTLKTKLINLAGKINTPIRYISAIDIAYLRESLLGSLPMKLFTEKAIENDIILDKSFMDFISESLKVEHRIHTDFVKKILKQDLNSSISKLEWDECM